MADFTRKVKTWQKNAYPAMCQANWQHRSGDTAKKAGLSVSAFIEKAVEGLLGRSCLLVENSRLSTELEQNERLYQ